MALLGPTPQAWIESRMTRLHSFKDASSNARTLRVTEAADAEWARKKLAQLKAKELLQRAQEHSQAQPVEAAPPSAAAASSGSSAEDMLARTLLARLPLLLPPEPVDDDPVLPKGREATALRVALYEKTLRTRARLGDLELRAREASAAEADDEGVCLFAALIQSSSLPPAPSEGEERPQLRPSASHGNVQAEVRDAMARSQAARAAADRVLVVEAGPEATLPLETEAAGAAEEARAAEARTAEMEAEAAAPLTGEEVAQLLQRSAALRGAAPSHKGLGAPLTRLLALGRHPRRARPPPTALTPRGAASCAGTWAESAGLGSEGPDAAECGEDADQAAGSGEDETALARDEKYEALEEVERGAPLLEAHTDEVGGGAGVAPARVAAEQLMLSRQLFSLAATSLGLLEVDGEESASD